MAVDPRTGRDDQQVPAEPSRADQLREDTEETRETPSLSDSSEGINNAKPREYRITIPVAAMMIGLAVFFDLLQVIGTFLTAVAGIGFIICLSVSFISFTSFFIWFTLCGVNATNKNYATRMLIYMGTFIVELTPFIEAIPAITLGVVSLIIMTRIEDEEGTKMKKLGFSKVAAGVTRNMPILRAAQAFYDPRRQQVQNELSATGLTKLQGTPTGAPRFDYLGQMKQRQMGAAMRVNLTGSGFADEHRIASGSPNNQSQQNRYSYEKNYINSGGGEVSFGPGAVARGAQNATTTSAPESPPPAPGSRVYNSRGRGMRVDPKTGKASVI